MDMIYFEYELTIWEDEDEVTYRGVTCSDCYASAVKNISDCFGDKRIYSLKVIAWDGTNACLILSEEVLNEVREQW